MEYVPFVIERTFNVPVARLWSAITDVEEMKIWYFDIAGFKPEVGAEFSFTAGVDYRMYVHLCKVTEVVINKKLAYSWRYQGYEGNSQVTFDLLADDDKSHLKLTHTGIESFPVIAHDEFARGTFVAGWTAIIGSSLKNYLEQ